MTKVFLVAFMMPLLAYAQIGLDVDTSGKEDTTIEVKKGTRDTDQKFEVTNGTADIMGDSAPLLQSARKNWDKACKEWKQELQTLNKDNHVLAMNCGEMVCSTAAMESTCKSQANYKLKIQIR
jgi:hypothetical protein